MNEVDTPASPVGGRSLFPWGWYLFGVVCLTLLELRLVVLFHLDHWKALADSALGVTVGIPHWRVYQNRLVGPFLVKLIAKGAALDFQLAYFWALLGLAFLRNLFIFGSLRSLGSSSATALRMISYLTAAFIALQDANWLYVWDYTDLLLFSALCYGILAQSGLWYFALLFGVGIFGKESALFIPLFLMLDGVVKHDPAAPLLLRIGWFKPRRLLAGAVLLGVGIAIVEQIRSAMLVRELYAAPADATAAALTHGKHVHIKAWYNVVTIWNNLTHPTPLLNFLIYLMLIAIPVGLYRVRRQLDDVAFKLVAIFLALYSSIVAFGVINETRVYNVLLPFGLYLLFHLSRQATAQSREKPADPCITGGGSQFAANRE